MIVRNVCRYELLVPKDAKLTGNFIVNNVLITEYDDADVPKVADPYAALWADIIAKEKERALGTSKDLKRLVMKQDDVVPGVRGLLAGYRITEGVAAYQLTALAKKDTRLVALSVYLLDNENEAIDAVRSVLAAYRVLPSTVLTGRHESGWFYTRYGAVVLPPSPAVAAESFELNVTRPGMALDLEATSVEPSEDGPGLMESLVDTFLTWGSSLKRHRNDTRVVAGLKGADVIIEERGKLGGLWVHRPIRPSPPGPSARVSLETKSSDMAAFLEMWEPVLCSVKRHDCGQCPQASVG